MKMQKKDGFRRRIDPMRRVTLPSELAEKYRMLVGDYVRVVDAGGYIAIQPLVKRCVVCGDEQELIPVKDENICLSCLKEAGQQVEVKQGELEGATKHLKLIR